MNEKFQFNLKVKLVEFEDSGVTSVLELPANQESLLPLKTNPWLRIEGLLNDTPIQAAWTPRVERSDRGKVIRRYWTMKVSKKLQKQAHVLGGQDASLRFNIADQNEVNIPIELGLALFENKEAQKLWGEFKPGAQRGLAHYADSPISIDARVKRSEDIVYKMLNNLLYVQKGSKNQ